MRAAGYIRVSSAAQVDNWSLAAQRREIEAWCQRRGAEPVTVYAEEGASARYDSVNRRPQFRRLLADAKQGLFDILVVHSLDRWSRNMLVTLQSLKALSESGIAFASVTENIDYSTPEGRLMLANLAAFAQYFSDNLSKHTSKGRRERFQSGLPNGDIPFGYEKGPDGIPVPVEPEAAAVQEVYRLYAAGDKSFEQVARWLNERGLRTRNKQRLAGPAGPRPFTKETVKGMLHNPFYMGYVTWKDRERVRGRHEPVVTEELWERCQQVVASRRWGGGPRRNRTYLLAGLGRCVFCDGRFWAQTLPPHRPYYREASKLKERECPAAGAWTRAEQLDAQVGEAMAAIKLPSDWHDRALQLVSEAAGADPAEERVRLKEKLRRYALMYAEGQIELAEYRAARGELERRLVAIEPQFPEDLSHAGELLSDFGRLWRGATPEERARLVRAALDAVYCDPKEGVVVGLRPKGPFVQLFTLCEGLTRAAPLPEEGGIPIAVTGDPDGIRGVPPQTRIAMCCAALSA